MIEVLTALFGGLVQLGFLGLLAWAVVRAVGRRDRDASEVDQVLAVRQLFVYGLLLATLVLSAVGAVLALEEVAGRTLDAEPADQATLAAGLALVMVAGPAFVLLLRHARGRLAASPRERQGLAWASYLNLALGVSLLVTVVSTQGLFEGLTGAEELTAAAVAPVVVWGAVWAWHWFGLKATYGLPGDVHLAVGSATGLVTLALGAAGLLYAAGDALYRWTVTEVPFGHAEPDPRRWAVATAIGGAVWAWHWSARYQWAARRSLWHVHVVLLGALGGLVAAVVAATTAAYWIVVWFLGQPPEPTPSRHFEYTPVAVAALVVGAVTWRYHRRVLGRGGAVVRSEPLRAYDHLVAAAGLVAAVVGGTVALVALVEEATGGGAPTWAPVANRLILAAALVGVGGPLWWWTWSAIGREADADPAAELGSAVRRLHLVVLFGVGGIVVLVSAIVVVAVTMEAVLDARLGQGTLRSARVGLALVVTVSGVAWYHLGVFRTDRDVLDALRPPPPPPPPPPSRHIVLVAPPDHQLGDALARATGARVDRWDRTDHTRVPGVDVAELAALVEASGAPQVLVVIGPGGPAVVPFDPVAPGLTGREVGADRRG